MKIIQKKTLAGAKSWANHARVGIALKARGRDYRIVKPKVHAMSTPEIWARFYVSYNVESIFYDYIGWNPQHTTVSEVQK